MEKKKYCVFHRKKKQNNNNNNSCYSSSSCCYKVYISTQIKCKFYFVTQTLILVYLQVFISILI